MAIWRKLLVLSLVACLASPGFAQPAALWQALGVPQALKHLRDATVNPHGNHPGFEKPKPPKPIADPANLESDNPAIKIAAEIKQQEDLKKQKIKALKYLSKVGCGCYPGVADAFAAATEDCTEDVRLAAAEAIQDAAGEVCACCNGEGCCSEKLLKQLAERAYGRDDSGCFLEPSERVREAMRAALHKCCRGLPPEYEPAEPEEVPKPEPADTETIPEGEQTETIPDGEEVDEETQGADDPNEGEEFEAETVDVGSPYDSFQQFSQSSVPQETKWIAGRVKQIDPENNRVLIEHDGEGTAIRGAGAELHHRFLLREEKVGDLRVVASKPGQVVATAPSRIKYLKVGARVNLPVRVQQYQPELIELDEEPALETIASDLSSVVEEEVEMLEKTPPREEAPVSPNPEEINSLVDNDSVAPTPTPPEREATPSSVGFSLVSDGNTDPAVPHGGDLSVDQPARSLSPVVQNADQLAGMFAKRASVVVAKPIRIARDEPVGSVKRVAPSPVKRETRQAETVGAELTRDDHHRADRLSELFSR